MDRSQEEKLRNDILGVVCDVASDVLGIPRKEIGEEMELPLEKGMTVSFRMANAIPGGGLFHFTPKNSNILCTVGELADKCTEEMVRLLDY